MTARIGDKQMRTLIALARPTSVLLTPHREDRALVARGLCVADADGSVCISPAGLRALADALEAGRVDDGLTYLRKEREKRALIATAAT